MGLMVSVCVSSCFGFFFFGLQTPIFVNISKSTIYSDLIDESEPTKSEASASDNVFRSLQHNKRRVFPQATTINGKALQVNHDRERQRNRFCFLLNVFMDEIMRG